MSMEDPSQPLLPPSALFDSLGLGRSDAGIMINEKAAMRITTAQTCVRIISEDLASTAHEIFQEMPDRSMRLAVDHRLWPVLHDQPNGSMPATVFWGAVLASAVAWGNGYAWIKRDRAARVVSLVPLESGKTAPVKVAGELKYGTTQTVTGEVAYIDPDNILHIRGLSFDGVVGISPIQSCKNAFGLALAAEKFGAQFFGSGARATGVLSHPGQLEPEAYENLKKSVREWATGENALRPIILEEGLKWEQITVNPNDAQFLATRQFQKDEIAGLYRVPLHLVGSLLRATNNNIEHQSLDYIRYCLRPWAVRIEEEVRSKLLGGSFTMQHNLTDMQRGDFASQTAGIQTLRNIGYYSNNDIARMLRQNPIPAEEGGDIRMVQGAMIPLTALLLTDGSAGATDSGATAGGNEGDSQPFNRIAPAFHNLFSDAIGRIIHRNARAGSPDAAFAKTAIHPVVSSMLQALLAMRFGDCELTAKDLLTISSQADRIAEASATWDRKDVAAIARRMTAELLGALGREFVT